MNLLPVAQLFDSLLGEKPKPYEWRGDARSRPTQAERENLSVHVDEDALRMIDIKQMFAQSRIDRYNDRRLLLAIVAITLASSAGGARELISAFLP